MKRTIRLTESDLHRVIKESVRRILREGVNSNNIVPRQGMDFIDDDGNFVSIPEDPFYKEYSSDAAKEKRRERAKSRINGNDSRLWLDGGWDGDTLDTALDRLKNHPEKLELTPSEMQMGAVQWLGDPTTIEGARRIGANNMWELWDIDGYPTYILRKDWVKKHENEIFGGSNEEQYIKSQQQIFNKY